MDVTFLAGKSAPPRSSCQAMEEVLFTAGTQEWSYRAWVVPAHLERGSRGLSTSVGSAASRPMAPPHAPSGIKCQVWGLCNLGGGTECVVLTQTVRIKCCHKKIKVFPVTSCFTVTGRAQADTP